MTLLFTQVINPLNSHDAIKHHFTSLITDLIFLQFLIHIKSSSSTTSQA